MQVKDIKKLKIMGHEYKVKHCKDLIKKNNAIGYINFNKTTIWISTEISESRKRESILHEIIEALNCHMDLKLKHSVIVRIAEGMLVVLRDNGLLRL